jgi:tRNA uridine 5-carboxymethylaminomethyl modification enzyme
MESTIISGKTSIRADRMASLQAKAYRKCLQEMGLDIFRLKTGTPPRIKKESIDFSKAEIQPGQDGELGLSLSRPKIHPAQRPASVLA